MAEIPPVFDQPGAGFVTLLPGIKFPPPYKEWQKPENARTYAQAQVHKGNVGVLAGNGYIGLDKDNPAAFDGLELPTTTTWETRPGRMAMRFKCSDLTPELLTKYGKPADHAQFKLYKDGQPCGEVKLQRTYQVIPPSHKFIDPITGDDAPPGKGDRVDYKLLDSSPPATTSLAKLLADLKQIGITFSKNPNPSRPEANAAKLEDIGKKDRQRRIESDESKRRRYAEAALRSEVLVLAGTPAGDRNHQLFKSSANMGEFIAAGVLSENEVISELAKAADNTGLDLDEVRKTLQSGLDTGKQHPREIPEKPNDTGPKAEAARKIFDCIDSEELTEGGNAQRLERIHGDDLRYNHTHKKWYLWEGGRWKVDGNGGAMRLAVNVVGALYQAVANAGGKDERNAIAKWARETDSRKGLSNMLAIAANRRKFALTADDFDQDVWLLGSEDVTFDLKTCTKREPRRKDLITKAIGAKYDRAAKCLLWDAFLIQIFPDPELRNYIKKAVGLCLTGSMAEQIFFFCYGMGANGKSVFLAILRALLGEYARQADFSTFLVQRNEKVRNDLAALAGARVVVAIETEEGGRLSMQVIKSWTGGDPITARFLFGENFTFQPQGKLWLAANNKPAISERNHAAWRRVRLIPFNVTIAEKDQDKQLESKLLQELPGILNWALEGLADYLQNGLDAPKAVKEATNEYRKENDNLELFVSECCELGKLNVCKNTDLYGQYLNFCSMSGLKALSQKTFSLEISTRPGIKHTKTKHGVTWMGITLKNEWVMGCSDPSPLSGAAKGDGFEQNAQSTQKTALRENFAHLTYDPSPHSDCDPSPEKNTAVCVVCGEDLAGHGVVEKGGKSYCARPGCGYPARDEAMAK